MLDLKRQYQPLHGELLAAIDDVLKTQQFILGEPVAEFERAAANQLGVAHAIGCSSGTDALWLALAAAAIGPGDAVVTTPFSFFASVSSILRAGAVPILADIDPATFNLDPAAVESVLNAPQSTPIRAILPVHLYGQCADWTAFSHLANELQPQAHRRRRPGLRRRVEGKKVGIHGDRLGRRDGKPDAW